MNTSPGQDRWTVTHAHVRAVFVSGVGVAAALLLQRSDLLILVSPIVAVLVWAVLTRPSEVPARRMGLTQAVVNEGERSHAVVQVATVRDLDVVSTSVAPIPYVDQRPSHGATTHVIDEGDQQRGYARLVTGIDPQRWGRHRIGPTLLGGLSPWAAFRWGPVALPEERIRALPAPAGFTASAAAPHPRGLVGLHRSRRPGEGTEFASIRPFQWGDRLKRIHWARSLRSGQLHVTSSFADQDTHCAIVVDAHYDLGHSGGIHGAPSTLDHSVRSAAAIAEHFLHQGDRVSLQVLSARTPLRVPMGAGRRQHRRVLEALSMILPGPQEPDAMRRRRTRLAEGTLVVMVSALVSPEALTQAASISRSGLDVVVIDALVDDVEPPGDQEPLALLAWRIRLLEREREMRRIQQSGVPVVPWRGPGSLDEVLRSLARRGRRRA